MRWHTSFSVEECRSRLESAMDPLRIAFTSSGYAGKKEILGKVRGTDFRLQVRRCYRNSFAPFLYGQFVTVQDGTSINGEFKMHPFARVFMTGWFSFLAVFAIAALILPSRGQATATSTRFGMVFAACAMAAFGFFLVRFGRWLARDESRVIVDFLKTTLAAKDV